MSIIDEKHNVEYEEKEVGVVHTATFTDIDDGFDPKDVKRVMRKVDWRLLPILTAMYTVSQLDRSNLGLARQANGKYMDRELQLSVGQRYSIVTMMFFIPYILFEMPSQIGLRRFGGARWLGGATFLWGIAMLGMGFAQDWGTLAALRAVLGIFESALFPGAAYLIACWYPRRNMATRNVIFYNTSNLLAGFSGVISYGVAKMHMLGNQAGWRWIFIIYSLLTVSVAVAGYLLLQDFPDRATFLDERERHIVMTRIERDRADSVHDGMSWAKAGRYALDWKIWVFAYMFFCAGMAVYSLAYFLPTMLGNMGFDEAQSLFLVTPPNVWSLIPAFITAYLSDKYKIRASMVAFNSVCVIVGTAMYSQLPAHQLAARYVGVFLACGGCQSNIAHSLSWAQASIRAQSKRAFTSAMVVAGGGLGGIVASLVFMQKEAKAGYPTGVFFTIGTNAGVVVLCGVLWAWFKYQNRRADRGEVVLEGDAAFRYQG